MSVFSDGVVKQDNSQTSNSSFENRISRWTCMLERQPGGDTELQVAQDTGICCQQKCGSKSNWITRVNGGRDKTVCVNLPERSRQIVCKYCAQAKEVAETRHNFNLPFTNHCNEIDLVNRPNSEWANFAKIPTELRGRRSVPNIEFKNFIGLLQKQIEEVESFSPLLNETQIPGESEIQVQREKEVRDIQVLNQGAAQKRRLRRENSESTVEDQARATLEVNHRITESHQLLHVKTIIGLLHSIIDVILFTMSGSLIFDLNDSDIWKGFALRCKELESQLGILIKNFLERKIAEKMTKKKKREENVVCLIESIEERPTRSKVNRLRTAMESLMENERQLGLLQGEIIFIRDITLISESLRDLFNFMEAELSSAEKSNKPSKLKRSKTGVKSKSHGETKDGKLSGDERAVSKQSNISESKEQPGSSEQPHGGKTPKGTPGDAPTETKPKEEKPKAGKSPEKPEKVEEIKDQMVKAIQGKVGELGDQLGGQVKQMGGRVFQGLLQKAKDMTNLNINNGTSAVEDVEDLDHESHSPISDDSDSVSNASISKTNLTNSNRPNILQLMHVMRKFAKKGNKERKELSPCLKTKDDSIFLRQRTPEMLLDPGSDDSDVSSETGDFADHSDTNVHRKTRKRRTKLNESETSDDISDTDKIKVLTHSNKRNRKSKLTEEAVESELSSLETDYSESETSGEVRETDLLKKHQQSLKQRGPISSKPKRRKAKDSLGSGYSQSDDYKSIPNRQTIQLGGPKLSFLVGDVGVKYSPEGKIIDRKQDASLQNNTTKLYSEDPAQSRQPASETAGSERRQTRDTAGSEGQQASDTVGRQKARDIAGSGMFPRLKQLSFYEKPEIQNTMVFVEEDSVTSVSEEEEVILSPSKDVLEFLTTSLSDSSVYTKPIFEDALEFPKISAMEIQKIAAMEIQKIAAMEIPENSADHVEEALPEMVKRVAKKAALYTCTALGLGLGSWSLHYSYKCYSECKFGCFDLYGFEKLLELRHL